MTQTGGMQQAVPDQRTASGLEMVTAPPVMVQQVATPPTEGLMQRPRQLEDRWRVAASVAGTLAAVFGGLLAWNDKSDGIAVAAAFALAAVLLIFGLMGVVPASVKVGDFETVLTREKEQAKAEGAKEGGEAATVKMAHAARAVREAVADKRVEREDVHGAVLTALTTDQALVVPQVGAPAVPLPTVDAGQAKELAEDVAACLLGDVS